MSTPTALRRRWHAASRLALCLAGGLLSLQVLAAGEAAPVQYDLGSPATTSAPPSGTAAPAVPGRPAGQVGPSELDKALDTADNWLGAIYNSGGEAEQAGQKYGSSAAEHSFRHEAASAQRQAAHAANRALSRAESIRLGRSTQAAAVANANRLQRAGKWADRFDKVGNLAEGAGALVEGDRVGVVQAATNAMLSGVAAELGAAGGVGLGALWVGAPLGPGGMLAAGIGGAVVGSVVFDQGVKKYAVDPAFDKVSRDIQSRAEAREREWRRIRSDVLFLERQGGSGPEAERIRQLADAFRRSRPDVQALGESARPTVSALEAIRLHDQADAIRRTQAEQRAGTLPAEKIKLRLQALDKLSRRSSPEADRELLERERDLLKRRVPGVDQCPGSDIKVVPGICGCDTPDTDTDGDGTPDCKDACPQDPAKAAAGICGCGTPETDTDGDGTPDCKDLCPRQPAKVVPGLCGCDTPETDSDGDGTPDCLDGCKKDPRKIEPGQCGCGIPDTDTDGDNVPDCQDECPSDRGKISPGICGCGNPDIDTDGDGALDCHEQCPRDPSKKEPGTCGCDFPDTGDWDRDGVLDCIDGCPDDPAKAAPGRCGCRVPDTDSDGDGMPDCLDRCPHDPNRIAPDSTGCGPPVAPVQGPGAGTGRCPDNMLPARDGSCVPRSDTREALRGYSQAGQQAQQQQQPATTAAPIAADPRRGRFGADTMRQPLGVLSSMAPERATAGSQAPAAATPAATSPAATSPAAATGSAVSGTTARCTRNAECPSNAYCDPASGRCQVCPTGQHPYRDGKPGCHSETAAATPATPYRPKGTGEACTQVGKQAEARCKQIETDCTKRNCAPPGYSGCALDCPGCGGYFGDYIAWCELHPSYQSMVSAGLSGFVGEIQGCIQAFLADGKPGRRERGWECQGKAQKKLSDAQKGWVQQACQARCAQDGRKGVVKVVPWRCECE